MQFATEFADPSNGHVPTECGLRGIGPRTGVHPVSLSVFEFINLEVTYVQSNPGKKESFCKAERVWHITNHANGDFPRGKKSISMYIVYVDKLTSRLQLLDLLSDKLSRI